MNRIEIFKPGRFVAMNGRRYEFTEADLQATATAYDPALHEAPMVVGHPKDDAPAYGWGKALEFADGGLHFIPDQVDPAFAELHRAGRFKKRSASFYAPDDANNPVPGVYYLRHLGFLGAQPPAVKGLKAANFADQPGAVTVEFGEWSDQTIARIFRKVKNFFIEKYGKAEADKVIDEWELEEITREALRPAPAPAEPVEPGFSEPPTKEESMTPEELKQKEAELAAREAKLTEQSAEFAERERAGRRADLAAYVDDGIKAGKFHPAEKAGLVEFLETLQGSPEIAFGEGKAGSPETFFRDFVERRASHPLFKTMTPPAADQSGHDASFAEGLTGCI